MSGSAQPPSGDNGLELYDDKPAATSKPASTGKSEAAIWYVAKPDGEREGPFPLAILKARASSGHLAPTDLLWTQGFASWQPAQSVPELYPPAAASMPIPPSAPHSPTITLNIGLLKSFISWIATPGFLRVAGRTFGVLSLLTLFSSVVFYLFIGFQFTNIFLFAFMFIVCEALAAVIESQRRIESLLQSRAENREGRR